ncbi:hypothetical protein K4039_24660 [Lyngbya sp. CCAP 1446/10]|uniref:hypothetical protein n=1 Tax=Microcoleaceae TaxID=1892252 RepID=UPI0022385294|nr:hypothetical protein [Lyngbya sp. CCAP 1446/10]MCW6053174.1 hypothetical protein [Lyngbya sp. CCAP 1446/10]
MNKLGIGHWALGEAKRRDWAKRSGGIGRSEAEGLGEAKRRDWALVIGNWLVVICNW